MRQGEGESERRMRSSLPKATMYCTAASPKKLMPIAPSPHQRLLCQADQTGPRQIAALRGPPAESFEMGVFPSIAVFVLVFRCQELLMGPLLDSSRDATRTSCVFLCARASPSTTTGPYGLDPLAVIPNLYTGPGHRRGADKSSSHPPAAGIHPWFTEGCNP